MYCDPANGQQVASREAAILSPSPSPSSSFTQSGSAGKPGTLNAEQAAAVACESGGPVLVIAGAGTGKTATLCNRVGWLLARGVPADRIGLLTFSRRAADEMVRRVGQIVQQQRVQADLQDKPPSQAGVFQMPFAGTFHSVAARLLRQHAQIINLNPAFSIIDRGDSTDLIDWLRNQQGLAKSRQRFPRAATCLNIYSDRVNCGEPLSQVLRERYPWCTSLEAQITRLLSAYTERKLADALLDYDDLLLWWSLAMRTEPFASRVAGQFDHVLVDEFQDSNDLQLQVIKAVKPDGCGLFVVGDDAQSIYSFRAARVEHIQQFATHFEAPTTQLALTVNYRSGQLILDTANALMSEADTPFKKNLSAASRRAGQQPILATVLDDAAQADYVVQQVLREREAGIALKRQAVLFRSAHHSDFLEIVLARHNIPFVKHGGLKFVEAAHVKDMLALLRWASNPRHRLAAFRSLQLIPGFGPATARRCVDHLDASLRGPTQDDVLSKSLGTFAVTGAALEYWPQFVELMSSITGNSHSWSDKLDRAASFIQPLLALRYDHALARQGDIEMLVQIAQRSGSAHRFLSEMALDAPNASGAWSDDAHLDEDYLILSTVHSAKGQEWRNVFVLNVADGNFPNEYSTSSAQAIEEERRLLYVAMTRAEQNLHLIEPQRYYLTQQVKMGAAHVYGARSRFLTPPVLASLSLIHLESNTSPGALAASGPPAEVPEATAVLHEPQAADYQRGDLADMISGIWK